MHDSLQNIEKPGEYRHPQPRQRRALARLTALLLVLLTAVSLVQVGLAIALGGLLFFGTAFLTALLMLPLLLQSVLHPEITLTPEGLRLHPLLWRPQSVPWSALKGMAAHPLIRDNALMGRILHGKKYRPREGQVILVERGAGLSILYWMLAWLVGAQTCAAFAISSTTHTRYEALLKAITAHCPR
jgi:hypothetical protein